jgi:hypothetical protein
VSVVLATDVPGIGDAPRGVVGTEMSGPNVPRSAAPSGAASAPGSSGSMCLELPGPYLPNSFDSVSLPINWRRVESKAELACSQVTTVLLHQILASVHHNILCPGKEK